jgi:hypothetical protein
VCLTVPVLLIYLRDVAPYWIASLDSGVRLPDLYLTDAKCLMLQTQQNTGGLDLFRQQRVNIKHVSQYCQNRTKRSSLTRATLI